MPEPHVITQSPDHQLIAICQQMHAVHQEKEALAQRDHYAPDYGPNHEQYEALEVEQAALGAELTKAAPPTTPEGIQVLAQLAMTFTARNHKGALMDAESFAEWLRLFALTSATGVPEAIPLPRHLPYYWPE